MKSAIVLGLALAANAMAADEELFVAHTGKFEHDLVQKFHGKIMFDEVPDGEFAKRPKDNNRDKEVVTRLGYTNPFFAADDELVATGTPVRKSPFRNEEERKKIMEWMRAHPHPVPTAANDDELAVRNPTPEQYQRLQQNKNLVYKYADEVADDELVATGTPARKTRLVSEKDRRKMIDWMLAHPNPVAYAADDEFAAKRPKGDNNRDKEVLSRIGYTNPFFAADDELAVRNPTPEQYQRLQQNKNLVYKYADDEFAKRPKGDNNRDKEVLSRIGYTNPFFAADDEFAAKRPKGDNNRDKEVLSRIGYTNPFFAADDELLVTSLVDRTRFGFDEHGRILRDNIGRPVKPVLARDDEGDDELLYLGQLITERAFIPRMYDDDELRAEKPSHVKAEERAQMKGELPKKQKKLRPRPDVIPMAEN